MTFFHKINIYSTIAKAVGNSIGEGLNFTVISQFALASFHLKIFFIIYLNYVLRLSDSINTFSRRVIYWSYR